MTLIPIDVYEAFDVKSIFVDPQYIYTGTLCLSVLGERLLQTGVYLVFVPNHCCCDRESLV